MNKINKSLLIRIIIIIFIASVGVFSQSCSGCSRSGIRHAVDDNKRQISRNKRNNPPQNNVPREYSNKPSNSYDKNPPTESYSGKTVAQLFKILNDGVFMVFSSNYSGSGSQGSGFFINSSGIGITNYHVLDGGRINQIKTSDGTVYDIVEILEKSAPTYNDYVIFRIDNKGNRFRSMSIARQKAVIGEDIFAIGSPRGLENSLTKGTISGYRDNNRIQIDATVDHGSSGGPLFNMKGEVIGITTSKIEGAALNFAVDIQIVPYERYLDK